MLALFIHRGYLELVKAQGVKLTNLIQVIERLGDKYLGAVKDSIKFPFKFVDLKEHPSKERNKRSTI